MRACERANAGSRVYACIKVCRKIAVGSFRNECVRVCQCMRACLRAKTPWARLFIKVCFHTLVVISPGRIPKKLILKIPKVFSLILSNFHTSDQILRTMHNVPLQKDASSDEW